jgi:hypothetical protein
MIVELTTWQVVQAHKLRLDLEVNKGAQRKYVHILIETKIISDTFYLAL